MWSPYEQNSPKTIDIHYIIIVKVKPFPSLSLSPFVLQEFWRLVATNHLFSLIFFLGRTIFRFVFVFQQRIFYCFLLTHGTALHSFVYLSNDREQNYISKSVKRVFNQDRSNLTVFRYVFSFPVMLLFYVSVWSTNIVGVPPNFCILTFVSFSILLLVFYCNNMKCEINTHKHRLRLDFVKRKHHHR